MLIPSFNSIGFPDWTFAQMVGFCRAVGAGYFEIRGLENTLDLLSLPDLTDPGRLRANRLLLAESGVRVLSLNLGLRLAEFSAEQGAQARICAEEIRRCAEMAQALDVPYLRFFGGADPGKPGGMQRLVDGAGRTVAALANFPVTPLVETHDALVRSADVVKLVADTGGKLRVLWDVANTVHFAQEQWQDTFQALQPYLAYLHVKDAIRKMNRAIQYMALFKGDLPLRGLLLCLKEQPRAYIVSFEWEKLWHPELAGGPVASLDFLEKIRKL